MKIEMRKSLIVAAVTVGALFVIATATAQTEFGDKLRVKGISGTVGLGVGIIPDYEGSNEYEALPFPILRIGWSSGRSFELAGGTVKVNLLPSKTWDAGPMINLRRGRDDDVDEPSVKLMREIDDATEFGAFLTWKHNAWNISASALSDVSDTHEGFILELSGGRRFPISDQFMLTGKLFTTFVNDDYMKTYFGVDPANSVASGLPVFIAEEGIKDIGATIGAMYRIGPKWSVLGSLRFSQLQGDAEDSPVVDLVGDAGQLVAGAGFAYSFGKRAHQPIQVRPLSH